MKLGSQARRNSGNSPTVVESALTLTAGIFSPLDAFAHPIGSLSG